MSDKDNNDLDLPTFAKSLAYVLVVVFWLFCIGIGYFIANDEKGMSIILLLILGSFLPIAARAVIGLIQEKYYGQDISTKDMHTTIVYTFIFLMTYAYVIYMIPQFLEGMK